MGAAVSLAQATSQRAGIPNSMRTGTVVSIAADGTLTVAVGGGQVRAGAVGGALAGVGVGTVVTVFKQGQTWQVQGAATGAGGNGTTPANASVVGGVLRQSSGTNVAALAVGSEVIANRTVTGTVPVGQLAQVRFFVSFNTSVANGQLGLRIRDGSVGGTQYGSGHGISPTAGFSYEAVAEAWFVGDGVAHTWVLTCQNFSASGTLNLTQSNAARAVDGIFLWGPSANVSIS